MATKRRLRLPGLALASVLALLVGGCAADGSVSSKEMERLPDTTRVRIPNAFELTVNDSARASAAIRNGYQEALLLLERGELTTGITQLKDLVQTAPNLAFLRIDLGSAQLLAGEPEAALEHLQRAVALSPRHPAAHNQLGLAQRQLGDFAAAKRSYLAALAVYPSYHYAQRNLAILCELYLADLECALTHYQGYAVSAPDDAEAGVWLADVQRRLAYSAEERK